jgi:hypothetical protein
MSELSLEQKYEELLSVVEIYADEENWEINENKNSASHKKRNQFNICLNGFGYAQSALMKIGLRKKAISWFR